MVKFFWALTGAILAGGACSFGTLALGASVLILFPVMGDTETLYLLNQFEYASMIVGVAVCGVVFLHIRGENHD